MVRVPLILTVQFGIIYLLRTQSFLKNNHSYPLIRTHKFAYQGCKKCFFSVSFAYVLNEWTLFDTLIIKICEICEAIRMLVTLLQPQCFFVLGKCRRIYYLLNLYKLKNRLLDRIKQWNNLWRKQVTWLDLYFAQHMKQHIGLTESIKILINKEIKQEMQAFY